MLKPTKEDIDFAKTIVGKNLAEPSGYRVAITPLPVDTGMKLATAQKYSALAAAGFQDKSKDQAEREERGQHFGILCGVGDTAFKGNYKCEVLPKVGDITVTNKYPGLRQEFPPGSGTMYYYCNDEDIIGVYSKNVLELNDE